MWNDTKMVGTFQLTFTEPFPINKQYVTDNLTNGQSASITLTSTTDLWILWGDGSAVVNVIGTAQTKSHTYATGGIYYVMIYGQVENGSFHSLVKLTEITL
jgi:hypothetical protein